MFEDDRNNNYCDCRTGESDHGFKVLEQIMTSRSSEKSMLQ